jgi:hypothetical protein
MNSAKLSKFFRDLHRDLVDRRLLIPLIALAVAIVAVPMLLSSSSEPVATSATAPADLSGASAVDAAVIVSDTGIRDYRRRLEDLKTKNPFDQQFTAVKTDTTNAPTPVTGSGLTPPDTTSSGSAPAPASDPSAGAPTVSSPPVVQTGPPADSSGAPADESDSTETVTRLITRQINVVTGPLGDTKRVKGVKNLTLLPSKSHPAVAFIGVSQDASHAAFAVSSDVTSVKGDGHCDGGGPLKCEFLTLDVGEQAIFRTDKGTYRLRLVKVADVRVRADEEQGPSDSVDTEHGAPSN